MAVVIAASDPPRALASFGATLTRDDIQVARLDALGVSGSGALEFQDRDGDVRLTAGDRFLSGLTTDARYVLRLDWSGRTVATETWEVRRPLVSLGPPDLLERSATVSVISASPSEPLAWFGATLWAQPYFAMLSPLGSPDGYGYALGFVDRDHDGRLSAGDQFNTSVIDALTYVLRLDFVGTEVANATWTFYAPSVTLTMDQRGPPATEFNVTFAQPTRFLAQFGLSVLYNGNIWEQVNSLHNGTSKYGVITYLDNDGDGRLSEGDRFVVQTQSSGNWDLYVWWGSSYFLHESWFV